MAQRTDTEFKSYFDILFADNVNFQIVESYLRSLVEDIKDSFTNNTDFGEGGGLVLDTGSTYNLDFQSKRIGGQHFTTASSITIADAVNPVPNAMIILSVQNTSLSAIVLTFASNSKYLQNGNASGTVDIEANQTLVFTGRVDGSGIIHWGLFGGGGQASGIITIGDLTFNPAVAQTYVTPGTHKPFTQTEIINFTADFTDAKNGTEKIYQIIGDGKDITFTADFVNSDDGVTQPTTINKTGSFSIKTFYDKSLGKIQVDAPIFGVGGAGASTLNDLNNVTIGSPAASAALVLRILADVNQDGTFTVVDWTPDVTPKLSISTKTANYTLVAADHGKVIKCNSAFAITITLPNGLATGFSCEIRNINTGVVTLSATGTLNSDGTKLSSQYSAAVVSHEGSNVWEAYGKLTT